MHKFLFIGCCSLWIVRAQVPPYEAQNPSRNDPPLNRQGGLYNQQDNFNRQNSVYNQPENYPNQDRTPYSQDPYNDRTQYTSYQGYYGDDFNDVWGDLHCPEHWVRLDQSCYRFIKSPLRPYEEARRLCKTYSPDGLGCDLVSIGSSREHGFLINHLANADPQHRRWYIGAYQQSAGYWVNADGSQLLNMEMAFLPVDHPYGKDYLAYNFSMERMHWGFQPVRGDEPLLFICEADIRNIQRLVVENRTLTYGIEVTNPEMIPRGPYFIKQPVNAIFDISKRKLYNYVNLNCIAGGYPTPTYEWYNEYYEVDRLVARKIDPLQEPRYTISGGMLIIENPQQKIDRGTYHCKASNKFGTIISESVQLNFGFILEFVLKRSPESGDQNWGKVVYCDPPNHYPEVRYSWSRDYFPNFVDEDKRVFVSYDGALYFSALETIDKANYSCSVQSDFSDSGRNGPFFPLMVNPHSNYQQLKFPNNFPKVFPEAPNAGKEVRMECMAFGYPVPSYNWTRRGAPMPRSARFSSYNRVLVISHVQVEDQGEYVCRAYNDRASIENSVILNIQAEPNFTIPLTDRHVDSKGELIWTCEAFGIPDVNYTWWKNGRQLVMGYLEPEDHGRIKIQDNVLTINYLDQERDPGMYQCRASNSLKIKYSSAQLRVLAFKPTFKKRPLESETYAAEQGEVVIKCNPEAAPRPRFSWKKDGNAIDQGGHRRILENGNLVIRPVSRDDEGVYTCTATNDLGMDESRGRLIVLRGPRLIEALNPHITTAAGRYFELRCLAETDEMLDIAYIWKHNGIKIRDIDIKNSNSRFYIDVGRLIILNTTFTDSGEYECVIKSPVGRISSKSIVIVQGPPGPPGGVKVSIQKSSVTLTWTDGAVHGSPISSYSISGRTNWNDTWLNISHGLYAQEIDRYTGQKQAIVENILAPWSTYEFRVAAWNSWGMGPFSAPSALHTTAPDKPYIWPYNIGGGGGKIGDLTITWAPLKPEEQNGPGIYYKIFWKRKDLDADFQSLELKDFGNTGMAVMHIPLENYYMEYIVKVQAINEFGSGPISPEHVIFSAEDMPLVAPQNVVARSFNSTALNVTWDPIGTTREVVRGKLIGYRLKYWLNGTDEAGAVYYLSRTTKPWALIVGLQPDTHYVVKVMGFNSAGEGPQSDFHIERTFRKAPQKPPSSVHVVGINPSSVKVVWRYVQPSLEEEPLKGYKIRIWEFDQDISTANDTVIPFGGKLEAYINNLQPGKTYRLRVLAFSNGGDGRMSSPEVKFRMGPVSFYRSTCSTIKPLLVTIIACIVHLLILR